MRNASRTNRADRLLTVLALCAAPAGPLWSETVTVWDTLRASGKPLPQSELAGRSGWRRIDQPGQAVTGDLCAGNGTLMLVLRPGAGGAECHPAGAAGALPAAALAAVDVNGTAAGLESARVVEVAQDHACVEARFGSATVRYRVRQENPCIEVEAGEGAAQLRVAAPSRHAVLPDPLAGDLVLSAADTAAPRVRFPGENLLVLLAGGGEALVACAWPEAGTRVALNLEGAPGDRAVVSADVGLAGPGARIWVAPLSAPGIWAEQPIAGLHPVKDTAVNWRVPFRALWRANFRRTDGLIDSWRCPIRTGENAYEGFDFTPKKARTVWMSARGTFAYPACIEGETCLLRKTRYEPRPELRYDDSRSVVLYPCAAIPGSPPGALGATDVLLRALAGAPGAPPPPVRQVRRLECDKWPATCTVTAEYEQMFEAGEERARKQLLLERLEAMNNFVLTIRSRMNDYLEWAAATREWLAQSKAARPELAAVVDEADASLVRFWEVYEQRKLDERNPAAARALIEKVIALIDSNQPAEEKTELVRQIGRDTRTIGGSQDSAIGEFRLFTRQLRQRAGYRMIEARSDAEYEWGRLLRERTLPLLQVALGHEGAFLE